MPASPPATAKRLGEIIKRERQRQGIRALHLADKAQISRSYMTRLEKGTFDQIRVDKLVQLTQLLGLPIEQVLEEAGYLPKTDRTVPEPAAYLRQQFNLTEAGVREALSFLRYLADKNPHPSKLPRKVRMK